MCPCELDLEREPLDYVSDLEDDEDIPWDCDLFAPGEADVQDLLSED